MSTIVNGMGKWTKAKRASEEARHENNLANDYITTIFGVMKKINSSVSVLTERCLKRLPSHGISPSKGVWEVLSGCEYVIGPG